MTPRSSIFSFETLRARPRWSWAIALAAVLLVGAELWARHALAAGKIQLDQTARNLLDSQRRQIASESPDIWLVGNSTLFAGVDAPALAERLGRKIVKITHGSATVRASAILLDYYIRHAPRPPSQVVLFVTVDDFNARGSRALISKDYTALCDEPMRRPQERLVLWQARAHIVGAISDEFDKAIHLNVPSGAKFGTARFDGVVDPKNDGYLRLVRHYELDREAIGFFAQTARRHKVEKLTVVLVPATDTYVRFHDAAVPDHPYPTLRADIAHFCEAASVPFRDFGTPLSQYDLFSDAVHLSPEGRAKFTAELASPGIIEPTPAREAISHEAASLQEVKSD